ATLPIAPALAATRTLTRALPAGAFPLALAPTLPAAALALALTSALPLPAALPAAALASPPPELLAAPRLVLLVLLVREDLAGLRVRPLAQRHHLAADVAPVAAPGLHPLEERAALVLLVVA